MQNLLGLRETEKSFIKDILNQARAYAKTLAGNKLNDLQGKTVALLFFESSTRTRISFEIAIRQLGGNVLNLSVLGSSIQKGETLRDTFQNIESLGINGFIVRHPHSGTSKIIASYVNVPVINAGDGLHEHPTQALIDVFTLEQEWGSVVNKKILIIGDILHSRIARSDIWALRALGAEVYVFGPQTVLPVGIELFGVEVVHDLEAALSQVDGVIVLRIQLERESAKFIPSVREYEKFFSLTLGKIQKADLKKNLMILHPGPVNRSIEMQSELVDFENGYKLKNQHSIIKSKILKQANNSVVIRMSLLKYLLTQ